MRTFPEVPFVLVVGDEWYRLMEPYRYEWMHAGDLHRITVPSGFEFDGASIPGIARVWLGTWSLGLGPPCVHDMLYRWRGVLPVSVHQVWDHGYWRDVGEPWSRSGADRLMGRMMREKGIPRVRRRMAYRAVRVGGWWPWLRHGGDWT